MARIFITGSSDGLGSLTAQKLAAQGHRVVLHARNAQRAADAAAACPSCEAVLVADLTSLDEIRWLAAEADASGAFDAVVHSAGLYLGMERVPGKSGLPSLFCVNTLAPYMLSCLMARPRRLVFVSSGMHRGGSARVGAGRSDRELEASGYGDSKLQDIMLAKAFASRWPDVQSNAVNPGWVPTKMGGVSAPGDMGVAVDTFVMAALGEGAVAGRSGAYFTAGREDRCAAAAGDAGLQDSLLGALARISGVEVLE